MIDVCLLLEGTYPYVTGGVSACVHQIIQKTPHLSYGIIHIGVDRKTSKDYKYELPENVKFVEDIYLFEYDEHSKRKKSSLDEEDVKSLFNLFFNGETDLFKEVYQNIFNKEFHRDDPDLIFSSEGAWNELISRYNDKFIPTNEPSFVDYFYNWRFSLFPVIKVMKAKIPKAKVYHSLCTGYAGLLGCVAKMVHNRPFILSEHGIYVHERIIEISQANWLQQDEDEFLNLEHRSFFKDWWIKLFTNMGQLAYDHADDITSLYQGNIRKQIKFGAAEEKINLITNGIDVEKYSLPKITKAKNDPVHIALVGRVVPIKDIKTFVKSIAFVYVKYPQIKVSIIGPLDEDEAYYDECVRMVKILDLENIIEFTGKKNVLEEYPKIDLMALSSISEGQPIVILEAMASGIPFVSTDVGSCKELLIGMSEEDKDLGVCGLLVPFGDVQKMGNAILELVQQDEVRRKMGEIAKKRVQIYYNEEDVIKKYNKLYRKNMAELF